MSFSHILDGIQRGTIVRLSTRARTAAELKNVAHILQAVFAKEYTKHQDIDDAAIEKLCVAFGLLIESDDGNGSKRRIVAPNHWGDNSVKQTVMPFHAPHGATYKLDERHIKSLGLLLVYFGAVDARLARELNLERFELCAECLNPQRRTTTIVEKIASPDHGIPFIHQGMQIRSGLIVDLINPDRRTSVLQNIAIGAVRLCKEKPEIGNLEPELLLAALRLLVLGDTITAILDKFRDRNISGDSFAVALHEWLAQPARKTRSLAEIQNELQSYLPATSRTEPQVTSVLHGKMGVLESAFNTKQSVERKTTAPQKPIPQLPEMNPVRSPFPLTNEPTDLRPYVLRTDDETQLQRFYYLKWLENQCCQKQSVSITDYVAALSNHPPQPLYWLFGANNFFRDRLTLYMTEVHMAIVKKMQGVQVEDDEYVLSHLEYATDSIRTPPDFFYHIGLVLYNINHLPKADKSSFRDLLTQMQQPVPKGICPTAMVNNTPTLSKISFHNAGAIQKHVASYYTRVLSGIYERCRLPEADLAKITFTSGRLDEPFPPNKVLLYRQPFALAVYTDPDLVKKYFHTTGAVESEFRGYDPDAPGRFKGLIGELRMRRSFKTLDIDSRVFVKQRT